MIHEPPLITEIIIATTTKSGGKWRQVSDAGAVKEVTEYTAKKSESYERKGHREKENVKERFKASTGTQREKNTKFNDSWEND